MMVEAIPLLVMLVKDFFFFFWVSPMFSGRQLRSEVWFKTRPEMRFKEKQHVYHI